MKKTPDILVLAKERLADLHVDMVEAVIDNAVDSKTGRPLRDLLRGISATQIGDDDLEGLKRGLEKLIRGGYISLGKETIDYNAHYK